MKHGQQRRITVIAIAVVAALGLAAAVEASIPDGAGVIHGCYNTGSNPSGQVRVIDTANGGKCGKNEQALNWNQQGPVGPQGLQGPQGPQGAKGDPGSTYTAGTGLELSSNALGIQGSYQLPQGCSIGQSPFLLGAPLSHPWSCFTAANAGESCDSGKFQNGVDAGGDITCATPPSSGNSSAGPDVWVTGNGEYDAPNSTVGALAARLSLPAGAYLVNAKGVAAHDSTTLATSGNDVNVGCELRENGAGYGAGGTFVDGTFVNDEGDSINPKVPFSLSNVPSSGSAFTVDLWCRAFEDGMHLEHVVLTAIPVGAVNQQ